MPVSLLSMGIEINGKHSWRDFGLSISSRSIGFPERQAVTVTIPYMSGYYDFSSLYGGPYYTSRLLSYTFDLLADGPEELEQMKNSVLQWAETAEQSKILDDIDPDYYFVGSLSSAAFEEDENVPECGGELTLNFVCQPFRYRRTTDEEVL